LLSQSTGNRYGLRAGLLIDGTGNSPLENAAVLVEDGRIASVVARDQISTEPDFELIDLGDDAVILPGLIDCHLHLTGDMVILPHEWVTRSREELYDKAVEHAGQALRAGVTTLRDCGAPDQVVIQLRDAIARGEAAGPHILSSDRCVTTPGGHGHFMGVEASGVEAATRAVETVLDTGADFVKVIASGGGGTPGTYPWDSQFSEEELCAVVDTAHRRGKPVCAHAHASVAIEYCIDAGVDTIEHVTFITAEGPCMNDAMVEKLARSSSVVVPTVACYRNPVEAGLPKTFIQKIGMQGMDYVELHQSNVRQMLERGVRVVAGTDGVQVGVSPCAARDEARYMAEIAGSNMFGIQSVTRLAAEAIGVAEDRGTVKAGKRADLLIVERNPLEDVHALKDVRAVIKDGKAID